MYVCISITFFVNFFFCKGLINLLKMLENYHPANSLKVPVNLKELHLT